MSQFIQSEIRLIHTYIEPTPTEPAKPTEPRLNDDDEVIDTPKVNENAKDTISAKKIINASVVRRTFNMGIKTVEGAVFRSFDRRVFAQNFVGNSRGARKIQNEKTIYQAAYSKTKSAIGGSITGAFIGGSAGRAILLLQALNLAQDYISEFSNFKMQLEQYNTMRDKEIFSTRYGRDRLNWFNRRR